MFDVLTVLRPSNLECWRHLKVKVLYALFDISVLDIRALFEVVLWNCFNYSTAEKMEIFKILKVDEDVLKMFVEMRDSQQRRHKTFYVL